MKILIRLWRIIKSSFYQFFKVFCGKDDSLTSKESKYKVRLLELFLDQEFVNALFQIIPVLSCYLNTLRQFPFVTDVPADSLTDVARFCVLSIEVISLYYFSMRSCKLPQGFLMRCFFCCRSCTGLFTKRQILHSNISVLLWLPFRRFWKIQPWQGWSGWPSIAHGPRRWLPECMKFSKHVCIYLNVYCIVII